MKILESLKLRWVVWVWNHTPNCAEMARLSSRSLEQPPGFKLRMKMRLHWLICAWCKRYASQLHFLHTVAPRLGEPPGGWPDRGLSVAQKQRIVRRLQEQFV